MWQPLVLTLLKPSRLNRASNHVTVSGTYTPMWKRRGTRCIGEPDMHIFDRVNDTAFAVVLLPNIGARGSPEGIMLITDHKKLARHPSNMEA